jgi:hypothetical protein
VKLLTAFLMLIALNGCDLNTTDPVPLSNYCALTKPISYDSTKDTQETVAEIEAHNSRYECVCNRDCPKESAK